jgi:hypothetical protein
LALEAWRRSSGVGFIEVSRYWRGGVAPTHQVHSYEPAQAAAQASHQPQDTTYAHTDLHEASSGAGEARHERLSPSLSLSLPPGSLSRRTSMKPDAAPERAGTRQSVEPSCMVTRAWLASGPVSTGAMPEILMVRRGPGSSANAGYVTCVVVVVRMSL